MELWELSARESVRDTLALYAHGVDTGRFEEVAGLFTPDGLLAIAGQEPLRGRPAILGFLQGRRTSLSQNLANPYIRHHVTSVRIVMEGPELARAWSYFLAVTERGPDHWGRYRDELVPAGNLWQFRQRHVRVDGHAPDSWRAARSNEK